MDTANKMKKMEDQNKKQRQLDKTTLATKTELQTLAESNKDHFDHIELMFAENDKERDKMKDRIKKLEYQVYDRKDDIYAKIGK